VLPCFREYERSMTTILNARVMPVVSAYVAKLDARIAEQGVCAPLLLMKSSGGVTSTRTVRRAPVETALSGPAAGAVGAARVGSVAGHRDLIAIDIGGTSADISLISGGEPGLTTHGRVGEWPVGMPMVDLVTIGAGGGSIARVTETGALAVGPQSAGAVPGPVCYGRGGLAPTVTDAHLAARSSAALSARRLFRSMSRRARRPIRARSPSRSASSLEAAARGILAIVGQQHGRRHPRGVGRAGTIPRDFSLLPFGGRGPLHGGALARLLGMRPSSCRRARACSRRSGCWSPT
jgi:N-methylhydantoinase A